MQGISPSKFWSLVHECSATCGCIEISDEKKAVINFENGRFEGCGRTKDESIEIALYKLFYNHFKVTLIHWSHYWETNLDFADPIPDDLLQAMKHRILGKIT